MVQIMNFKVRMIERYSPHSGTWYVLKIRILGIYWLLPKVYNDKVMAEQAMSELGIMFDRRVCEKVISEREIEA